MNRKNYSLSSPENGFFLSEPRGFIFNLHIFYFVIKRAQRFSKSFNQQNIAVISTSPKTNTFTKIPTQIVHHCMFASASIVKYCNVPIENHWRLWKAPSWAYKFLEIEKVEVLISAGCNREFNLKFCLLFSCSRCFND
jgi:hypothetical protein